MSLPLECSRDGEERETLSEGNPHAARISGIGVRCVAGRYSKALLNYLAASNLPEPTYTRHARRIQWTLPLPSLPASFSFSFFLSFALSEPLRGPVPKSKSPLTGR